MKKIREPVIQQAEYDYTNGHTQEIEKQLQSQLEARDSKMRGSTTGF